MLPDGDPKLDYSDYEPNSGEETPL